VRSAKASGVCKSTTSSTGISSSSTARTKGLTAAFAVFGLFWGAWAACLPAIQQSTGASEAQLGLALLAVALAAFPALLAGGRLADVFGARLVPIGLVTFGLAATLPALAGSVPVLAALLALVGLTTGLLDVAINAEASRLEAAFRIRLMDGLHAAFSVGVLVGGVGAGLLRKAGAHPSWILAGVGVLIAVSATGNRGGERARAPAQGRARPGRALLVIGGVLALAFLVENGLEAWSALFLERTFQSSPAISGLGPGLFAASMAGGRIAAQHVARPSVAVRMAFAGLAAAAGLTIAASARHPAVALLSFVVAGAGLSLSAPTLFGAAGRIGGETGRGAAVSTVAVLGYLGFVAGPPLIGAVAGAVSLRGAFVFLAVVSLLVAASAPVLRGREGESGP
jgi:MFS family permease